LPTLRHRPTDSKQLAFDAWFEQANPYLHAVCSGVNTVKQPVSQVVSSLLDLDLGRSVFSVSVGIDLSTEGDGDFLIDRQGDMSR
jgi:hypothetical protein